MRITSKFKMIVVHTAHDGVSQDFVYELLNPTTFRETSELFNTALGALGIMTVDGPVGFRPSDVVGFELQDQVKAVD